MKNYDKYFLPLKNRAEEKKLFKRLDKLCSDFFTGKTRNNKFLVYKTTNQLKNMVSESLTLARENNKMLKKVRSTQKWANYSRIFYWILIIGISIGGYYLSKSFFNNAISSYTTSSSNINDIINQFGGTKK